MAADPSELSVVEVRELLSASSDNARRKLGMHVDPRVTPTIAALCHHYLDNQPAAMTASEFAGLVVNAIDVDLIEKEKLDKKREPTVEGRDECEHFLQAFQMARAIIRRTAAERNIEIVEPKKCQ